jgi:hypothetical protein
MSTLTHAAGETGKWIFGIGVLLVALAVLAVVVLFLGAFAWFFVAALWGMRLWFALIGAGLLVAATIPSL